MPNREPAPFWEMLETAERAPRTSAWERRFLASIRAQIEVQDQPWLSDDRSRILACIALKAGVTLPDAVCALLPDHAALLLTFAVDALGDPRLTEWEDDFLGSLIDTGWISRPLSDKQTTVLERIARKLNNEPGGPSSDREFDSRDTQTSVPAKPDQLRRRGVQPRQPRDKNHDRQQDSDT